MKSPPAVLRKDQAYDALKDFLLQEDDSKAIYSERALSSELDFGLASIRSATERLRSEGIIETIPKAGIRLPEITAQQVLEFFEMRLVLEPYIVRKLAGQLSTPRIAVLDALIDEQKRATDENDHAVYHALDLKFHDVLCELYGNSELIRALALLRDKMFRLSRRIHRTHPERLIANAAQHERIVAAIRTGRADDAFETMVSHLTWGRSLMLDPDGMTEP